MSTWHIIWNLESLFLWKLSRHEADHRFPPTKIITCALGFEHVLLVLCSVGMDLHWCDFLWMWHYLDVVLYKLSVSKKRSFLSCRFRTGVVDMVSNECLHKCFDSRTHNCFWKRSEEIWGYQFWGHALSVLGGVSGDAFRRQSLGHSLGDSLGEFIGEILIFST